MEIYYTFLITTIILIIIPGIDTALITKNVMVYGYNGGFYTIFGVCLGLSLHALLASLGVSILEAKSSHIFHILQCVGALYLIYLGIKTLFPSRPKVALAQTAPSSQLRSCFLQGLLTNVLNPKVVLFFLTYLPQFVTNTKYISQQMIFLGLGIVVLNFIWYSFYINLIGREIFQKASVKRGMEMATGFILFVLGLKLVWTEI